MTHPLPPETRAPQRAGEELLVLQKWESFAGWLLLHTAKWPKSCRFTLAQRLECHALDVLEDLVTARYEPKARAQLLRQVNLRLERMRFLFRLARERGVASGQTFESFLRQVDEVGRMLHGWRETLEGRNPERPARGVPA